MWKRFTRQQY